MVVCLYNCWLLSTNELFVVSYFIHALHYLTQISVNTISARFNVFRRFHFIGKITNATDVIVYDLWWRCGEFFSVYCDSWLKRLLSVNVYIYIYIYICFKKKLLPDCFAHQPWIWLEMSWLDCIYDLSMKGSSQLHVTMKVHKLVPITTIKLWVSISFMARYTRYNIMW